MKNVFFLLSIVMMSGSLLAMNPNQGRRAITPPPASALDLCEVKEEGLRRAVNLRALMSEANGMDRPTQHVIRLLEVAMNSVRNYVHTAQVSSIKMSRDLNHLANAAQNLIEMLDYRVSLQAVTQGERDEQDGEDRPLRRVRDRSPTPGLPDYSQEGQSESSSDSGL
ncbi:hypothetical protein CVU75_02040 [Candidatus Dependentiae bacterium HGW-Dependentiae-1]|nr:MAG: hypothetical protein CVU75_02040 [Candidatus Dependentiae bacterium HGW-Dependentiae-1]